MTKKIFFLLIALSFAGVVLGEEVVSRIDITGNKIVSDATVISKIKVRSGQTYNKNVINEDVKNLYATGFFETVEVEKKESPEGLSITFTVKEKPVLKKITIKGARFIRDKKILDSIDLKEGSFVNEYTIKEAVRKIKDLYSKKGFSRADVDFDMKLSKGVAEDAAENEAEVTFTINEKGVLKVRGVAVNGNKEFPDKRIIRLMKTRKAWLLNRGVFKEDVLQDDVRRVNDFYKLQGFSDAKVSASTRYEPKGVYAEITIEEGKRYYIGEIKIEGNREVSLDEIKKAMVLKKGSIFSEQAVYEDSTNIREIYVDKGYIFSQIEPYSFFNPKTEKVDVTYKISENEIAYIENISIRGNAKTKDSVIRRELRVYPGERFDGKKARKSKERLENLGYFEEIRFGTEPGTEPNKVDLLLDVKEAKTGYFSFGGGYSSIDEFIGFVELRQRNFDYRNFSTFTGAGQDLSVMLSMGTMTDRYQLSFTNPWIFNRPISFGFDGYKKGHKQNEDSGYAYSQDIRGGDLRLGKEFNDNWRAGVSYRFERVNISDVVDEATQDLKDEAGINNVSSGEAYVAFDTRDNVYSTLKGIYFMNNFQAFGGPFGGDKDFLKYFGRLSFYIPAVNKSVVEIRFRGGWSDPFSSTDKVPIYERFFAGGADTVRGYRERKVGPIDKNTSDPVGGDKMLIGNIEYTYPLADFLKVATFCDSGKVWGGEGNDIIAAGFKSSVGLGLRVKTPIGPVSVDYGWPLNLEPGEDRKQGRFHFNVSKAF
ncbi:MAG: outer membrane protein assembly factor BamA [Candidatus Omnitrophica bacterium]|nr:outer membrane protein assembly factor BamA [Candidatus Omnitrophota bacterium]MDD5429853.1 outer membrane protein assembly factor BamA [Candidatus Omnitrophota bacterium]